MAFFMAPESFVRLGWSFFKTVLRGLFPRKSSLARFESQYRPDGMLSSEPSDHAVQMGAGRCIGCGACDLEAVELGAFEALGHNGPRAFVQGASRHTGSNFPVTAEATEAYLTRLEGVCPVRVPFVPLVALVRRRNEEFVSARRALVVAPSSELQ